MICGTGAFVGADRSWFVGRKLLLELLKKGRDWRRGLIANNIENCIQCIMRSARLRKHHFEISHLFDGILIKRPMITIARAEVVPLSILHLRRES